MTDRPTDDITTIAAGVRNFIVPTSDHDESYAAARRAALHLASAGGATVVLYDRSDERWTDTPHPEGPFGPDEIETDRRPHLPDQMQPFIEAGVDIRAWYASVPSLTAIISAIQALDADAVVVPDGLAKPRVMDRLQGGGDPEELIGHVLDQNLERPVHLFVVDTDSGEISITTTEDRTDRSDAAPSIAEP